MDVNGSRFKLLLGDADWAACTDGQGHTLKQLWANQVPHVVPSLQWDDKSDELTLRPDVVRVSRRPPRPARRGSSTAAAPAPTSSATGTGSGRSASTILVESAGDGSTAQFWPGHGEPAPAPKRLGTFGPAEPVPAPPPAERYAGGAVTDDHFLVVGTIDPPGLLVFDLLLGGPPSRLPWPPGTDFRPFDIARRPGGGVFVLDAQNPDTGNQLVWELDRNFHVVPAEQPAPESPPGGSFEPVGGDERPVPQQVTTAEATPVEGDPIAIEALPGGGFLVLDRNETGGRSLVSHYAGGVEIGTPAEVADAASELEIVAYDMTLVGKKLFVVDQGGNQAYAFTLTLGDAGPALKLDTSYFPMRLFGGKGLVTASGKPWYDFGDGWIPLVAQPRARFVDHGVAVTPVLDGGEPGCVWHRLMIDACLPPDTWLAVSTIAADDESALSIAEWSPEPTPVMRPTGAEVPFVDLGTYQTYELLFQRAQGRYLQIKLELFGERRSSPRVRAIRAWFPRFSYLQRYLPGVYRQDPVSSVVPRPLPRERRGDRDRSRGPDRGGAGTAPPADRSVRLARLARVVVRRRARPDLGRVEAPTLPRERDAVLRRARHDARRRDRAPLRPRRVRRRRACTRTRVRPRSRPRASSSRSGHARRRASSSATRPSSSRCGSSPRWRAGSRHRAATC